MKILIEGQKYSTSDLELVFDNSNFYTEKGAEATINSVGYYHSFSKGELAYMLPKVFMKDSNQTIFDISSDELLHFETNESFKHSEHYNWTRQLLVYFYNSLKEYKNRYAENLLTQASHSLELNTSLGENEYTYLDLLLSFVNFYKKNKTTILFKHIEFKSNRARKPKWEKTIRKSMPFLDSLNTPIYLEIANKKKNVNNEEELITYFFSILNHFNKEYQLNLKIDPSYELIEGSAFVRLQNSGLSKLRKIKHRYFSDVLRRMFRLCELYFQKTDLSNIKRKKEEFISVKNYNIIFEDMVDKLFSDELDIKKEIGRESISLDDLKYNNDGKIIDHIYEYQSLIDTSNIFYIGDSKYYKADSLAGKVSQYKQFTYAKNVIQFNIDLLNEGEVYKENIRYRDDITEGYNITPNFFIYGYINDINDFDTPKLNLLSETPIKSFHFEDRLFDRDTLFVHQYQMNFLFILKAYSISNQITISEFRKEAKLQFRKEFIKFFGDSSKSKFTIYEKEMNKKEANDFVNPNFKQLNGKCFYTNDGRLLVAQYNDIMYVSLDAFNKIKFT
ncbi:hypothetical protein [Emticicia sp. C21]|uniref:hypothetical protein n=1 Tax=Emticicia sp. C21 TaxID=2302915 RepID=UPI000E340878|nr:hypothetical protein [Emticicia sp. C21]RFS17343.1 hypothetical protein D0T08_06070 [Emticicia sp. C21]